MSNDFYRNFMDRFAEEEKACMYKTGNKPIAFFISSNLIEKLIDSYEVLMIKNLYPKDGNHIRGYQFYKVIEDDILKSIPDLSRL